MSKKIIVERDVEARMRDGVILRADVYHPEGTDSLPALLQRTPYGKAYSQTSFALMAAERGYAVIIQDTRGRWTSEGINYPLIYEMSDGYDTLDWAAHLPYCNGILGMFGGSYLGYTQLAAAVTRHPALKTIVPIFTFCNPFEAAYNGGALSLGATIAWGLLDVAQMDIVRYPVQDPAEKMPVWGLFIGMVDGMAQGKTFNYLPLRDMPLIGQNGYSPFFSNIIDHPIIDQMWQSVFCEHAKIDIPAFHIGGWYDTFIANTLQDYTAIRDLNHPPQKVLVGPWTHGNFAGLNGEVDFGIQADGVFVLPDEVHLRWFDYWLKGIPNGVVDEPPIRIFVMGENQWRNENEWPLERTQYVPYFLHSLGNANSLQGDGFLSPEMPTAEPPDQFVYDPQDPVPTCGGGLLGWQAALPAGGYDQREVESRPDVLVYTTPVLEQDVEVTGPLQVTLWAASSAVDTDFTAKLVDVHPNGYAQNIQDGILRARCRQTGGNELITPGEAVAYTINMAATSNVFKAGHCIRVEISSSNFPRFDRNPNTGSSTGVSTELQTAHQTVFHDAQHPSHILLPIIPGPG